MSKSRRTHYYDPRAGEEPVRIDAWRTEQQPTEPPRSNCFSIYWVEAGAGEFCADHAQHHYSTGELLFFTPYQYLRLLPALPTHGARIQFHANFLCVETFHAETGCAGELFSDLYHPPIVKLTKPQQREVGLVIQRMLNEQQQRPIAYAEMLLAQLKVLLILATRAKANSADKQPALAREPRHAALSDLKQLIEQHYPHLHAPADYARLLHMTPKTLGRVVREQLGKSLTALIRERILTHAKWQLLHTLKPVKEVAREVGFSDELYFSRMFKQATGLSPTHFREFETEIRGGSNLSMLSPPAPIRAKRGAVDNTRS